MTARAQSIECTSLTVGGSPVTGGFFGLNMTLGGPLDVPSLPLANVGSVLAPIAGTITTFAARRLTAGSSGTTTIQLEVNGAPVGGATLSWTNADANEAVKTVGISQVLAAQDRLSFRLTSAEVGAEDIIAEAH
jgi:hypothetical protein